MPWGLLGRLVGAFVIARLIRRGRPPRGPSSVTPADLRRRATLLVEDARLVRHTLAAIMFALAGAVGGAAGVTLLALGPRWLGGAVAVIAAALLGFAVVETLRTRQSFRQRRWRRRLTVVGGNDAGADDVDDDHRG